MQKLLVSSNIEIDTSSIVNTQRLPYWFCPNSGCTNLKDFALKTMGAFITVFDVNEQLMNLAIFSYLSSNYIHRYSHP